MLVYIHATACPTILVESKNSKSVEHAGWWGKGDNSPDLLDLFTQTTLLVYKSKTGCNHIKQIIALQLSSFHGIYNM